MMAASRLSSASACGAPGRCVAFLALVGRARRPGRDGGHVRLPLGHQLPRLPRQRGLRPAPPHGPQALPPPPHRRRRRPHHLPVGVDRVGRRWRSCPTARPPPGSPRSGASPAEPTSSRRRSGSTGDRQGGRLGMSRRFLRQLANLHGHPPLTPAGVLLRFRVTIPLVVSVLRLPCHCCCRRRRVAPAHLGRARHPSPRGPPLPGPGGIVKALSTLGGLTVVTLVLLLLVLLVWQECRSLALVLLAASLARPLLEWMSEGTRRSPSPPSRPARGRQRALLPQWSRDGRLRYPGPPASGRSPGERAASRMVVLSGHFGHDHRRRGLQPRVSRRPLDVRRRGRPRSRRARICSAWNGCWAGITGAGRALVWRPDSIRSGPGVRILPESLLGDGPFAWSFSPRATESAAGRGPGRGGSQVGGALQVVLGVGQAREQASNGLGGKATPRSSISWKKRA